MSVGFRAVQWNRAKLDKLLAKAKATGAPLMPIMYPKNCAPD